MAREVPTSREARLEASLARTRQQIIDIEETGISHGDGGATLTLVDLPTLERREKRLMAELDPLQSRIAAGQEGSKIHTQTKGVRYRRLVMQGGQ